MPYHRTGSDGLPTPDRRPYMRNVRLCPAIATSIGSEGRVLSAHRVGLLLLGLLFLGLVAACTPVPVPIPNPAPITRSDIHRPTLDDFWTSTAEFVVDVDDTGLPMGESDTVLLPDGRLRSYVHASHPSAGVVDSCGAPVEFPGCMVNMTSDDGGRSFSMPAVEDQPPTCQIDCIRCPCDSARDHIDQQQYPRVIRLTDTLSDLPSWLLVYEYRANTILRHSQDGLTWSPPVEAPLTGVWQDWLMPCRPEAAVGEHPFAPRAFDCLVGSPPGIYVDQSLSPPELYVFVGLGQNPSHMGCLRGPVHGNTSLLQACSHNPLLIGAPDYGPPDLQGAPANAFFDFRTISSADILQVGNRFYLFFEGVRGPGPGDLGDTQFLLGLARTTTSALDGPWELYPGNPILLDLPGNVGVGHADVIVIEGITYLYTSLDGTTRSRLQLVWR